MPSSRRWLPPLWALVDVEVVRDHQVALLKRRRELGSHVGVELVCVYGSIDDKGNGDSIAAKTGDKGLGVPFAKCDLSWIEAVEGGEIDIPNDIAAWLETLAQCHRDNPAPASCLVDVGAH